MPTIITRRQGGILVEATLLPSMCSMIRSQFPTGSLPVEQHWKYPDNTHGTDNAMRHWDSLADQMREEVRRSGVSCRIDQWRNPDRAEYVLGPDMEPPPRLVDVGDCHMLDESIPF
jgi:hypothetical protein